MRRKLLIVLLALGTVGGYASGFASMRSCHNKRRDNFEQHVAKVCVDAARKDDAASARAHERSQERAQPATYGNGGPAVIVQVNPPAANAAPVVVPVPAALPAQ